MKPEWAEARNNSKLPFCSSVTDYGYGNDAYFIMYRESNNNSFNLSGADHVNEIRLFNFFGIVSFIYICFPGTKKETRKPISVFVLIPHLDGNQISAENLECF